MNSNISKNKSFTNENLKKQFRLSEFLAEKIISSVAFLSIAMIVLIFVFVFKESLPLFHFGKADKVKTEVSTKTGTEGLKPESYGGEPAEELKPETYGSEPVAQEDLKPEAYGDVVVEPIVAEETRPETYGDVVAEPVTETKAEGEVTKEGEENTWGTFFSTEWVPVSDNPRFGLLALLIGTLKVTIIAMLIAGPIAVLAALYTSTFASKRAKEIIKPIIELLAAFPSVVIGFFALMVLATFFQDLFGYETRLNAFVGGVAMALAAIPIIYTISEDALAAVPSTYTEASLALGASKWQTAFFVTLPAAIPGIFAALLLGVGRVFGETMIALMATGNAALISANPFESVRTFAATIGSEMAETVFGDTHYSVLFFIGSLLFIFSFGLNAVAEFYVKGKLLKKFQGK
jgi:phosphate transport system permease protein